MIAAAVVTIPVQTLIICGFIAGLVVGLGITLAVIAHYERRLGRVREELIRIEEKVKTLGAGSKG